MMKKNINFLLFLFAAIITVQAQSIENKVADVTTSIEFEEPTFQWGELIEGEKIQNVFTFTNTGTEPLIIMNAKGSCGCTVPRWPKEPIMPGETADLLVEFNSAKKGKVGGAQQSKRVTITANTEPANTYLTIKGTVVKPENRKETETSKKQFSSFDIASDQIKLYPNPTRNFLNLKFKNFHKASGQIEIYNEQGHKVETQLLKDLEQEFILDVSSYPQGTYTVSFKVEGKNRIAKRFVVLG